MGAFAALGLLATFTLDGEIRLATWLFLGLFAVKTVLAMLRKRAEEEEGPTSEAEGKME
jgi:hypothetical protein